MIDLHTHSNISDGTEAPAELIRQAHAASLSVVALTDHDSTAGWDEARAEAHALSLGFVPGIEVSAVFKSRSIHLLAFGVDPSPGTALSRVLARLRESRLVRARDMVERIGADYPIAWDDVIELASADSSKKGSVGRPHIADALIRAGAFSDRGEAFASVLAPSSPYYVPYESLEAADAIRVIHDAGGAVIGAHVMSRSRSGSRTIADIRELIALGLDGLEVHHREHSPDMRAELHRVVQEFDLIETGGSDYHGTGKPNRLGENTTAPAQLERLLGRTGIAL